jgi:inner membrane protein
MTLALSEHVPFAAAYWLSTAAVTGLCAFYCALIFRRKDTVFATSAAVVASYAVIFVLLRMEDYALLAGALVMFVLLGILMGMTGRMNRE